MRIAKNATTLTTMNASQRKESTTKCGIASSHLTSQSPRLSCGESSPVSRSGYGGVSVSIANLSVACNQATHSVGSTGTSSQPAHAVRVIAAAVGCLVAVAVADRLSAPLTEDVTPNARRAAAHRPQRQRTTTPTAQLGSATRLMGE